MDEIILRSGKRKGGDEMVRVYIDGKEVADDELENYEITKESVKRIFAQALARINAHSESDADRHGENQ